MPNLFVYIFAILCVIGVGINLMILINCMRSVIKETKSTT